MNTQAISIGAAHWTRLASLVALFVAFGCGTLAPPADLVSVQQSVKDEQLMARAKQAAPEQYKASMMYRQKAEEACDDGEAAECEHFAVLAKYKLSTAMEHAAMLDAVQRRSAAVRQMYLATKVEARETARRKDIESRIARMERIAALQKKVAQAGSTAEAQRAKLAVEAEKARLEAQEKAEALRARESAFVQQKQKLDLLLERDALFDEASMIVGADNVKRVKRGIVVTARGLFEPGKAIVQAENAPVVERLAALVNKYDSYPVVIEGYTDSRGRAAANLALSQARAQEVMNRFLTAKVAMDRVKAIGYGKEKPITDNSTREGRALNRRIEVVFLF